MEIKTVLVTGGGGFLGGALVKRLAGSGVRVTSYCRRAYPKLELPGIEQVRGDIRDKARVREVCKGKDVVFHTAAKTGIWGAYADYDSVNVAGTENVIASCMEEKVACLVHTSSPSVVFDGTDMEGVDESAPYPARYAAHYPKTKALAEQAVRSAAQRSLPAVVLRPHLIWGPEDTSLVPRIVARAKRLVRVGTGANLVDTVYIDNAADAHIRAAESLLKNPKLSGRIYFISQGEPIPLWEMIDLILEAAGRSGVRRSMPFRAAWTLGAAMEGIYSLLCIRKEPLMTRFLAEELARAHWFDISAARRDLGYRPEVSTAEGLKRLKEWLEGEYDAGTRGLGDSVRNMTRRRGDSGTR